MNSQETKVIVTDIERFAVHDGPGIRTVVFVKGCPLSCLWCCNPETQQTIALLGYSRFKCLLCLSCIECCSENALSLGNDRIIIDRKRCTLCGICTEKCPTEALELIGKTMTASQVLQEVLRDQIFFSKSGGGLTISGGEPLYHPTFLDELLTLTKKADIHTAIETCGYAPKKVIESLYGRLDLWLFDIKHMDSTKHREWTGVSNEPILENLSLLANKNAQVIIRVPLIPGFNDSEENISETADFVAHFPGVVRFDLLPYHRLGTTKYLKIGLDYRLNDLMPPDPNHVEKLKSIVASYGVPVTIGG